VYTSMEIFFLLFCEKDEWFKSRILRNKIPNLMRIKIVEFIACNLRKKEPLKGAGFTKTL